MPRRQEIRSEETKRAILAAAGQLFAEHGFDAVTMRAIAKAAECSHTTIYIYFKDKAALLHQLAMGPLHFLQQQMESLLAEEGLSADERLRQISRVFILFCLNNRTMYTVLFMASASRVDEEAPVLAVQQLRNHLFSLLRQAIALCVQRGQSDDQMLAYARIYFFTLHGILGTYITSTEPLEALMQRLAPTVDLAVSVLVAGFKETMQVKEGTEAGLK